MNGRRPVEPEPHYRQWLHALEDDPAVADHVMQVARVYADFAAGTSAGSPIQVRWSMLKRCTHQRNDKLSKALEWLRDNGWLAEMPTKTGARKYHVLTTPDVGSAPDGGSTPDVESGSTPDVGSGSTPDVGSTNVLRPEPKEPSLRSVPITPPPYGQGGGEATQQQVPGLPRRYARAREGA